VPHVNAVMDTVSHTGLTYQQKSPSAVSILKKRMSARRSREKMVQRISVLESQVRQLGGVVPGWKCQHRIQYHNIEKGKRMNICAGSTPCERNRASAARSRARRRAYIDDMQRFIVERDHEHEPYHHLLINCGAIDYSVVGGQLLNP